MVPDCPDPDTGGHRDDSINWIIFMENLHRYLLSLLTFINKNYKRGLKYQLCGLEGGAVQGGD